MNQAEIREKIDFLRAFGESLSSDAIKLLSDETEFKQDKHGDVRAAAGNAVRGAEQLNFLISQRFKNTQDYTSENYAEFIKETAGMIPAAYIFVELAKSKNTESSDILKDMVVHHPEIELIIDRYCDPNFSREGYSAFWDLQHKMGKIYDKAFPGNTAVDKYYLRPLHIAINNLEDNDLKKAYQTYYKVLHDELKGELQRYQELPLPAKLEKIEFYKAVGIKYFKLINILNSENSDISSAEKEKAIKEAYEFSSPSWISRALKTAATKLMVAVSELVNAMTSSPKTNFEKATDELHSALQTKYRR